MIEVIGVGSLNEELNGIASFTSWGMNIQAIKDGVGIFKPDILTYGENVPGLDMNGDCIVRSGTSVSASIVSGSIAAIISRFKKDIDIN